MGRTGCSGQFDMQQGALGINNKIDFTVNWLF